MSNVTTILLVGATGALGGRIAGALLAKPNVRLRLLVRPEAMTAGTNKLTAFERRGAEIVSGDLSRPETLPAATAGVDVVISAVQGLRETIVDGQLALLEAAKRNGVRRLMPSDFAIDLFKLGVGDHPAMDWRREADEAIAASGLEHVHVLNGAFMEVIGEPFFNMFDYAARSVSYWGDGEVTFDITTIADVARFTAEAALDRDLPSGKFAVAGDQLTMHQAIATAQDVFGQEFDVQVRGSIAQLETYIAEVEANGEDLWEPMFARFQWVMALGTAKLSGLANDRYPGVKPRTYANFLTTLAAAPTG